MFNYVYLCLSMFTIVFSNLLANGYPCLLVSTYVDMFAPDYLCLLLFIYVYHCLLMFTGAFLLMFTLFY